VDNGHPPDDEPGEAWVPDDESGDRAWDDGSGEIWDEAQSEGEPRRSAAEADHDEEQHTALPPKVEAWRRRSATGAVLTGFAFGLQQVFEPKKDDPAVIMETSGEPPKDLPVEADFEYGRPRNSVVNIRPWLLPGDQDQAGDQAQVADPEQADDQEQAGDPPGPTATGPEGSGQDRSRPEGSDG
jgi:hypothetical protein